MVSTSSSSSSFGSLVSLLRPSSLDSSSVPRDPAPSRHGPVVSSPGGVPGRAEDPHQSGLPTSSAPTYVATESERAKSTVCPKDKIGTPICSFSGANISWTVNCVGTLQAQGVSDGVRTRRLHQGRTPAFGRGGVPVVLRRRTQRGFPGAPSPVSFGSPLRGDPPCPYTWSAAQKPVLGLEKTPTTKIILH